MSNSTFQRKFWILIIVFGVIGSSACLYRCSFIYFSYPSNVKISIDEDPAIEFPHIGRVENYMKASLSTIFRKKWNSSKLAL